MAMSLEKGSSRKLLLPKLQPKPDPLPNPKPRPPGQMLSRTIARAIERLSALSKSKFRDVDSLLELSQQLANIAMECRNEQSYFVAGYRAQQEIKYLRLKVRTLETDLQFRQEQVIKLQNRIKAMSDFYSKECKRPRSRQGSPAQLSLGLSRIRPKYKVGELSQLARSEYGIGNRLPTPRMSSQIDRKQNTSPERITSHLQNVHIESNSTEASSIQPSTKITSAFLTRPLQSSSAFTKLNAPLKASKALQTEPNAKLADQTKNSEEKYEKKLSELRTKNKELSRLVSIYKSQCFELTERQVRDELLSLRHSLSLD